MRNLRRHADALAQRGVRVNRLADAHGISAHLDGQRHVADHVARVGADHAAISVLLLLVVAGLSWFALRLSNPLKDEERA